MREKLIRLLGQCPCDGGKELGNCPYRKHGVCAEIYKIDYCAIQNLADHLIANGVTVQEWISVKDRLPEKNTDVLVYTIEEYIGTDFLTKDGKWFWNEEIPPSHWMPLPQPPKGE